MDYTGKSESLPTAFTYANECCEVALLLNTIPTTVVVFKRKNGRYETNLAELSTMLRTGRIR